MSQFLETYFSTGNTVGRSPNFEMKYLKTHKSQKTEI